MKPTIIIFAYFLFLMRFNAQVIENSRKKITKKVEVFILEKKLDSASFFLNQLKKNSYTEVLSKIKNREVLSCAEYTTFLKLVKSQQAIKYISISNFINEFIKEPTNLNKINLGYVNIKWNQVIELTNEGTLEAANIENKKLKAYVYKFNDADIDVLKAKIKITTHDIAMFSIKQDIKGKELCLKGIEKARKLKDVELEIIFSYYLTSFLVIEHKLQEFIDVSEQNLVLEKKLPKATDFHYLIINHLLDAYLYKGGKKERFKNLLNELYDNESVRSKSYVMYVKFLTKISKNSLEKKAVLNKFKVKNVLELTEKFKKLGKNLNQYDYAQLIGNCGNALIEYGFYKEGVNCLNNQILLIRNIYSKDLSETLANYKTDIAVKEKEIEIVREKEKTKTLVIIASLIGLFLLITLFVLRRINRQTKELLEKNILINKTLKEKELLMKELHHRVKNNFQIISSLLEIQSKDIVDKKALELVTEGKNRVKSMALIHQQLYQNESGLVDFDAYIVLLVNELSMLYKSKNKIKTKVTSKNMKFDVDTAIPLGLIINEIITNSYKYAFNLKKENILLISINKESNEYFKLVIEDNGLGLPDYFDVEKTKSLGLRLVNRLVKQLHGKLSLSNENGARFEIIFKDIHARKRID